MKRLKKGAIAGFLILGIITASVFGVVCYYEQHLPDAFYTKDGQPLTIISRNMLTVSTDQPTDAAIDVSRSMNASDTASIRLWGIIPVKTVQIKPFERDEVWICGDLFGIKLYTDGVLVVDIDRVTTDAGRVCPALDAGLKVGDSILRVNDTPISSNAELRELIASGSGAPLTLTVRREEQEMTLQLKPAKTTSGILRGGIWVRDSTAGIGTLTCIDPETGRYVGLGHGIYDADTGTLMQVGDGSICDAKLTGIVKGQDGAPGKLEGIFTDSAPQGSLLYNTEVGIGGVITAAEQEEMLSLPIALRQEVKTGTAYLCCDLDGEQPVFYEIEIEKVDLSDGKQSKNLVIRVTDERLLEKTGGIVQGMSGSPIIQNGKLIGAVTHVFVGRADKGYGIFIENMLDAAG